MKKQIIVLGGSGSMGVKICNALAEMMPEIHIIVGDYKLERGRKTAQKLPNASASFSDITNIDSLEELITDKISCVVVALKQTEPIIQRICSRKKVPCIDITAFGDFTEKVKNQLPIDSSLSVILLDSFQAYLG
ncbi:saccharopine dehydrogenase NADP-binding domain-containing protein [Enterococcus sp. DIV0756]|uniref:saccharopine dehydrogenase NADP-binding domain-containing protein n=1 Tax=Enterococcus sp. DIV0756 TaxID=2774636 RepID=UPI003F21A7E7